jgi:hypothetical protein
MSSRICFSFSTNPQRQPRAALDRIPRRANGTVSKLSLAEWLWSVFNWSIAVPTLKRYITRQKDHHRRVTFQDEYRKLLKAYAVEYDEYYVWD